MQVDPSKLHQRLLEVRANSHNPPTLAERVCVREKEKGCYTCSPFLRQEVVDVPVVAINNPPNPVPEPNSKTRFPLKSERL